MKIKTLNGNVNIIGKNIKKYRKLRKIIIKEEIT